MQGSRLPTRSGVVTDVAGLTHVGKVRANNEDQFMLAELCKTLSVKDSSLAAADQQALRQASFTGHLFVVADGMGGHAAGEDASALAVDAVTRYVLNTMPWFFRLGDHGEDDLVEALGAAVDRAQTAVRKAAEAQPQRRGMGTTLTLAYLSWPRLYVVHVGDTRCYLLHDDELRQVTTDHTLAQLCLEQGTFTSKEATTSPLGHVLLRSIGGSDGSVAPDVYKVGVSVGDVMLLCSDGLTRHLSDAQIRASLAARDDAAATCTRLVDAANAAGGRDNVTVVVARFSAPAPAGSATGAGGDVR